ncbi:hypothetical protein Q3G72_010017 [Acer saccharum]|nr:hypothetical protein Q3G72_010017 [Acer saccharum]
MHRNRHERRLIEHGTAQATVSLSSLETFLSLEYNVFGRQRFLLSASSSSSQQQIASQKMDLGYSHLHLFLLPFSTVGTSPHMLDSSAGTPS